jgi:hypothetical protein
MAVFIPIPVRRTVVSASRTLRMPFSCKSCGFDAVVGVVGRGAAETGAAPFVAPQATEHERDLASRRAFADGQELMLLVACPRCGKRDEEVQARWRRGTHTVQAMVAAAFLALILGVWMQSPDPVFAILIAMPGALAVFLVGYLRGLRVELSQDRVSFLSPEDLAAEEEQAAQKKAAEKAAQKERAEHRARTHPRRRRPRPLEEDT